MQKSRSVELTVLSWMPCIYVADSGMVYVGGLGWPSLLVCRITASPAQFCRCLLAIRGFWYGTEGVATHGTSSELFHRATVLRADLLIVKQNELPLHLGLRDVVCTQPWAMFCFCHLSEPLPHRNESCSQCHHWRTSPLLHLSMGLVWQSTPWPADENTEISLF